MHRVFLAHNACLNASYDFNLLREGLQRRGFEIVERPEEADEVIYSGCAVRQLWVDDAGNQINAIHARAPNAKVTITGCVASVAPAQLKNIVRAKDVELGSQNEILKHRTGFALADVDRWVMQDSNTDFEGGKDDGLDKIRRRVGPEKAAVVASLQQIDREFGTRLEPAYRRSTKGFVFYHEDEPADFITVTRSCLYKCSFCAIPKGRGPFTSVAPDDIMAKARASLLRGVHRITLVGDEVGNYGIGASGPKLRDLLTALLALDPKLRLSIRYIEPKPFVRDYHLFERLCGEGRMELLYISLQSGSQRMLDTMNRNCHLDEVVPLYKKLRDNTDTVFYCNWMVGFPGESDEDYQATKELVEYLGLQLNVPIPFSARPDTPAMTMNEQVSEQTKGQRLNDLTSLIARLKALEFSARLGFLAPKRRVAVLEGIELAEIVQYAEPSDFPGLSRRSLPVVTNNI